MVENPEALLGPLVSTGNRVLEVGPGMGFFTMELAERVGTDGHVDCVDVEPRMLQGLERRLKKHGLAERVTSRLCEPSSLGVGDLAESIDLAVLIHVLHEMPQPKVTLAEVAATLRPKGKLLLIEPNGHVSEEVFEAELAMAREVGFSTIDPPKDWGKRPKLFAILVRV
jgi:ubiquinone/menaquinone biosynthesis C-methylase UbiE